MRGEVSSLNKIAVSTTTTTPGPGRFSRAPAPPPLPPRYSSHCSLFDSVSVATSVSTHDVLNAIDDHFNKLHVDSVMMMMMMMIDFLSFVHCCEIFHLRKGSCTIPHLTYG